MPWASNVMSTSIVAEGWSEEGFLVADFGRFGAKAEERRLEIFVLSQVVVMESGNSLPSKISLLGSQQALGNGGRQCSR